MLPLGAGPVLRDLRLLRARSLESYSPDIAENARGQRFRYAAVVVTVAVPGWREDPTQRHAYRYHDGANWTIYVADANAA
jgi:Protein of unknown function (DUF2510)